LDNKLIDQATQYLPNTSINFVTYMHKMDDMI
jgi:hypothetical protein